MTASFRIDYEWLSREYGDEMEQATLAELAILFGEARCATRLEDVLAKTVRSSARLSAIRLAEWFVTNWWRLLWEPQNSTLSWRMSHKVSNVGGGYIWPDLSFSTDWESIQVYARPTEGWEGEPIRYLSDFYARISPAEFENGVDEFVDGIIARLSSTLKRPTELGDLWEQVKYERQCPGLSESRKLEACMGFDPDEAPDGLIDRLQEAKDSYGNNAIQEVAAVSKNQTLTHIETLQESAANSEGVVLLPEYDRIRRNILAQTDDFDVPWKRARRAAHIARESWGLKSKVDSRILSQIFSIPIERLLQVDSTVPPPLTVGLRKNDAPEQFGFLSNKRHPSSRRFAFARLLADHLTVLDNERLLPATDSKTARQKFQRAFAQEFLCPFEDLQFHFDWDVPTDDAIDEAAEYFEVSPRLVETALVNNGVLDRETLDDRVG
ncbi:MAG: hypothetical protein OXP10_01390 [Chloroflexota bacterium]|nr:hypothetical protein [Chloroflexota bacterium]MDE2940988.1 hypothetical protein [Chloroflexota bacterium]